jgi:transcriptional regulator with XRE-family HTH domain
MNPPIDPTALAPAIAGMYVRLILKRTRIEKGLTQEEAAKLRDWSTSKVLRMENGKVPIKTSDLESLLDSYEAAGSEIENSLALLRRSREPSISTRYRDVLPPKFADWLEFEDSAARMTQFETKLIPGILQIDEYASRVMKTLADGIEDRTAIKRVQARFERAENLTSPKGPKISIIIDENALRRGVGNTVVANNYSVMLRVLEHIKDLNTVGKRLNNEPVAEDRNPEISVQIAPLNLDIYRAYGGPFEVLEFDIDLIPNMLFRENPPPADDDLTTDEATCGVYLEQFAELKEVVPSPADTNLMIDEIAALMKSGKNSVASILTS